MTGAIFPTGFRPDSFFTAEQQKRLSELMQRWRNARDRGDPWTEADQQELEALIDAEVMAAGRRAAFIQKEMGR